MSKVIITIEDTEEGKATVSWDFDPPITDDTESTAALEIASRMIHGMKDAITEEDV